MSETSLFEKTVETHWGYALREGVSIEDLYQAFKARLMDELVAGKCAHAEFYIDEQRINGAPLYERRDVLPSPPTEGI
jgi:hypothetical protein